LNSQLLNSTTDEGVVMKENFAQLLILEATENKSADLLLRRKLNRHLNLV